MINQLLALRGATSVDSNLKEEIIARSVELVREMVARNGLDSNPDLEIVDCIISTTDDITAYYPARAVRESGLVSAPVFSVLEPEIDDAMPFCIRVLMHVTSSGRRVEAKHVYLHEAASLRPDLAE